MVTDVEVLKSSHFKSHFQVVEEMEGELKAIEKNIQKIRTILSSVDDANITTTEHLHNRQVMF